MGERILPPAVSTVTEDEARKCVRTMPRGVKERLISDACGQNYRDPRGLFRILRVLADGRVELWWFGETDNPVTTCTLDEAVTTILTQPDAHVLPARLKAAA